MSRKLALATATASSFIVEVLLFAPDGSAFASSAFQVLAACLFFAISLLLYLFFLRDFSTRIHLDWVFPAAQAAIILGVFFLLRPFPETEKTGELILTSLITVLASYALYISTMPAENPRLVGEKTGSKNTQDARTDQMQALQEQVHGLTEQLQAEKFRISQLTLWNELSQQLEAELDAPVSAQLAVNTLERAMNCSVIVLFLYIPEDHDFIVLASAGRMTSLITPGYHQDSKVGLLGRTTRTRKTHMINDTRLDRDFVRLENDTTLSIISVPVFQNGPVKGVLEICSEE
ncbi:MAG: GAF domain-containing protein, partial [Bacteroidota bacterium]